MTISNAARYVAGISAALLVAACSGISEPVGLAGAVATQQSATSRSGPAGLLTSAFPAAPLGAAVMPRRVVRPDHRRSWMTPGAPSGQLLYLDDSATGDVYTYSWPHPKQVGALTGFENPQGLCADATGNVWVTDANLQQVEKFAHGGTSVLATLGTPGQYPVGCAVDPRSGDLAVSTLDSTTLGQGGIWLFKNAAGSGTFLQSPDVYFALFDSYTPNGMLYLDGFTSADTFAFDAYNGKKFAPVTLDGATINFPGNVSYADGALAIGDQSGSSGYSVIYQLAVSGTTATVTGTTPLTRTADCVEFAVARKQVICPDNAGGIFEIYPYAAGGTPTKLITGNFGYPIGAVISP